MSNLAGMSKSLWIMRAPVISHIHLSMTTRAKLSEERNVFGLHRFVYDHGVFVFASDEASLLTHADYEDIPTDLVDCFRWAWGEDFEWIRFDTDGDMIVSLPLFEAN